DFRDDVDINLGVGYVNEKTIPAESIVEAVRHVVDSPDEYRQALNYGGPHGSPNLIRSLRDYYLRGRIGGLGEEHLADIGFAIGANGATSLLEALAQVLRKGIVISSDPVYYIYSDFLERCGFEITAVPEDDEGLRIDALEEKLAALGERRREISFIYLVTVSNPTCSILANDRRKRLVEIAGRLSEELGRKVPVVLDKAYEDLVHDPEAERPLSGLLWDKLGLVYELGTVSKILAPALRIGYVMGAQSDLLRVVVQRVSDVGFSAPLLNQEAASYMLDHHISAQLERVNAGYREKAAAVRGWIDEHLGEYTEHVVGGRAGFYFYVTLTDVETREGSPFFKYLSRTTGEGAVDGPEGAKKPRVVYIPGEICVHPEGDLVEAGRRQLRISYGFEDLERIEEAVRLMREAAAYARS
ncbi:MAG: aminotransferase class I/II-fold pyridoxal phosphate-dependent enzyme, partial [Planctomycetota bacterium]